MGALCTLIDAILFLYFLLLAVMVPLVDAQVCVDRGRFPSAVVDLVDWYSREYGDYLVAEKPSFFVGLVWLELLFQWPLSLVNVYGILAARSWLPAACLVHGASVLTSMVAILAELTGSGRGSEKLQMVYYPFIGMAALTVLRGMLPPSGKASPSVRRYPVARKKRA